MDEQTHTGIVVGVDGSTGSERAVQFAALEAQRRGIDLTLVHVAPDFDVVVPPRYVVPEGVTHDLEEVAHWIMTDAGLSASACAPDVVCTRVRCTGRTVPTLIRLARDARMLVLGHETIAAPRRLYTGAVTMGVAARCPVPVVSVPADWDLSSSSGRVVVGVKSMAHSAELLETAFDEAAARGARLDLVHAWALLGIYDDRIVTRTREKEWSRAAIEDLEAITKDLRKEYPSVQVDFEAVHGHGAHLLRVAAADADLLILIRRSYGFPPAGHLGGVARALLRDATCPVMVIPPSELITEVDGLELEKAGEAELG
jgi:nucleotide-binding universal stress UspA family protein